MNILCIDDDVLNSEQLADEIRLRDHDVRVAPDVVALEALLDVLRVEAIILDLMMPSVGMPLDKTEYGFATGVYIYEHYLVNHRMIPFVVLTAVDVETPVLKRSIDRLKGFPGFRGWLGKPTDGEKILEVLSASSGVDGDVE